MSTNGLGDASTDLYIFQKVCQPSGEGFSTGDFLSNRFGEAKGSLDLRSAQLRGVGGTRAPVRPVFEKFSIGDALHSARVCVYPWQRVARGAGQRQHSRTHVAG